MILRLGEYSLDLSRKTHIMGILNVTPDSFSDGAEYFEADSAIERAHEMAAEGADILDVGGQSTRPGAEPVPVEEELRRTVPVIEAISAEVGIPVSIDTFNAEVAAAALRAGASMINDISGLRFDPAMAGTASEAEVPVVIMHIKGTPREMQKDPSYEALVPEIMEYLREGVKIALGAGIAEDMLVLDPGIGFGKTFEQNLEIINRLGEFLRLGKPLLLGPSRKAFIGAVLSGAGPGERVFGTAAAVTACILGGASIVRVHDVKEISKAARMADAIKFESMPKD